MFNKKYTVTLLNSKWLVIKSNVVLSILPRKDEFIWMDDEYYEVINLVHSINKNQHIYIIINKLSDKPFIKSIQIENK